jgi:hypothetical protein
MQIPVPWYSDAPLLVLAWQEVALGILHYKRRGQVSWEAHLVEDTWLQEGEVMHGLPKSAVEEAEDCRTGRVATPCTLIEDPSVVRWDRRKEVVDICPVVAFAHSPRDIHQAPAVHPWEHLPCVVWWNDPP